MHRRKLHRRGLPAHVQAQASAASPVRRRSGRAMMPDSTRNGIEPGEASAWGVATFQFSDSCGCTPRSRHQALLAVSSITAVVSTSSRRADAVHAGARLGIDSVSLRARSSVGTLQPISGGTTSTGAHSGGRNRASALSLNSCPYLAIQIFHQRPRFESSVGAATILPRGGGLPSVITALRCFLRGHMIK